MVCAQIRSDGKLRIRLPDSRGGCILVLVTFGHGKDRASARSLPPGLPPEASVWSPKRTPVGPVAAAEFSGIISFLPRKFLLFQIATGDLGESGRLVRKISRIVLI
jgi:hypothetical protein